MANDRLPFMIFTIYILLPSYILRDIDEDNNIMFPDERDIFVFTFPFQRNVRIRDLVYGQRKQRSLLSRTRAKRWPTCPVTCGITQKRLPRLRVQTCFTAQKPLGRGTRRRIAVGDRAEDIGGVSGRWRRIDRHLESNSRSFVHSGSRSSMEARILGIRVKFQFRQPAEIYPGSSFKIIDDDRDTSSRRSNPPGIRLVEDEHRQNNSTHDRQPRAFSPRRAIERRRIPLDLVC